MTVYECINENYNDDIANYEVYEFTGNRHSIHTDFIRCIDDGPDSKADYQTREVYDYEIMSEEEYNNSILANSSIKANFAEWYDNAGAKVLVIIAEKAKED